MTDFDRHVKVMEQSKDPMVRKKTKEQALQTVRKYQRIMQNDPLLAKLRGNPFKGVNIKEVFFALDNLELNFARA
jgi:hypothetical protein